MTLLQERKTYRPFVYQQAFDYWLKQQQAHWLALEIPMSADVQDWKINLTEAEKSVIGGILKGFIQTEVHVNEYWSQKVAKWFPHPEIAMMTSAFAAFEGIHTHAYAHLNETLGIEDYDAFLAEPTAKAKIDRLVIGKIDCEYDQDLIGEEDAIKYKKEDIAKSLAVFSAFTEGVSLFSSFAVLLNFSRFNKLKGVGQIISWSIRDECYGEGTEILTPSGWVDLSNITIADKVGQYDLETGVISFVNPSRVIEQEYEGDMIRYDGEKLAFRAFTTPNHDMIAKWDYQKKWSKIKSKDLQNNPKRKIPVSGFGLGVLDELTCVDRFRIATQADGSISDRYTGELCGTVPVSFSFSKQRKITRFKEILEQCGFSYKTETREAEGNRNEQLRFVVNVPVELNISKDFDWISLEKISSVWARNFVDELKNWDGHIPESKNTGDYIYYSSVVEKCVDKVQAICSIGGFWATKSKQEDNRSDTFSDVYRLYIHDMTEKRLGKTSKNVEFYKGKVRCVTVPTGAIVLRYKNSVFIAGNCLHSQAGCWLFRQFVAENPEIWTDDFRRVIYQAARDTVALEDNFIDKVFQSGEVEGLNPADLKVFIRNRANVKLGEIGLKKNWKNIDEEALKRMEWFDFISTGVESQDFFAQRVSAYSKGVVSFDDIF